MINCLKEYFSLFITENKYITYIVNKKMLIVDSLFFRFFFLNFLMNFINDFSSLFVVICILQFFNIISIMRKLVV